MTAYQDKDLFPWLRGIMEGAPVPAGHFLCSLAETAFRADWENYAILRPALLQLKEKYPKYESAQKG